MYAIWNDLGYALRRLRTSPGFTLTVVLTLALGVGANAIVFSVLNALILRPLPVLHADRLMFLNRVSERNPSASSPSQSYLDYRDLRDGNRTFADMATYRIDRAGVSLGGGPHRQVRGSWFVDASENYFDMLGVRPLYGRFFHPSDAHGPNSAPYVVLSYTFWQSIAHGDPGVVGRTVLLNKHPFTVIGIAPQSFRGTELFLPPDFWVPLVEASTINGFNEVLYRNSRAMWVLGRLRDGVTEAQAEADLRGIASRLGVQYKEDEGATFRLSRPGLVGEYFGGPVRAFLFGVTLLAALVLIAACANLGSLFAARAADRSRELAIRLALGASRMHVARQLLTEALLLCVLGGAFGFMLANAALQALTAWRPSPDLPVAVVVDPDLRVVAFALFLAVGSALFFGLLPMRQVWQGQAYLLIKGGPAGVGNSRRWTLRDALLVVQIALCAVLLTSSLVAARGLARSLQADLGFDPNGALLASFDLNAAGAADAQVPALERRALDAVAALPAVASAGFITNVPPLSVGSNTQDIYRDGTSDRRASNVAAEAQQYAVSPGYFEAARTKLIAGRELTWNDDKNAPRVAVVNRAFAQRVLGPGNPIGQHFVYYGGRVEVVSLTEDGKYNSLTEDPTPAVFYATLQRPDASAVLVARTRSGDAEPNAKTAVAVRAAVQQMDPNLPVNVRAWSEDLRFVQFPAFAASAALGVMAGLAAMLAVTGIFGMASYAVSKRLRELGLRVALGAGRKEVLAAALGRPARLLLFGSAAGIVLGAMASRLLAHVVYQANSQDPVVLLGVVLSMALLALLATWLPARRALNVDPASLLREE